MARPNRTVRNKDKKELEETVKEQRLKYGTNLCHRDGITINILAVNNGYVITTNKETSGLKNNYIFEGSADVLSFIEDIIPLTGKELDFLDCMCDEELESEDEDELLPF